MKPALKRGTVPYFKWRDGRPRWEPGPKLRDVGFKGIDLKDDTGTWLGFEAAIAAATRRNTEVHAWRATGAPRLPRQIPAAVGDTCALLWIDFEASRRFQAKATSTKRDYRNKARVFLEWCGDSPVRALTTPLILDFWEGMIETRGLAMANGVVTVLRLFLSHCRRRGRILQNPAENLALERPAARVVLWEPEELAALVAVADAGGEYGLADAIVAALHTGQRQGDVLTLPDFIFASDRVALTQAKTAAKVDVPMTEALKARVAGARRRASQRMITPQTFVVDDRSHTRFNASTFGHRFAELRGAVAGQTHVSGRPVTIELRAAVAAGRNSFTDEPITDVMRDAATAGALTYGGKPIPAKLIAARKAVLRRPMPAVAGKLFLDLRDTAVTRLYLARVPLLEIAAITGHTPNSIHMILRHYVALNAGDATAAIAGLEAWLKQEGIAI